MDDRQLTYQECCDLIYEVTGRRIAASTFRGYVSRGQMPAPLPESKPRKPLFSRNQLVAHLRDRTRQPHPGAGHTWQLKQKNLESGLWQIEDYYVQLLDPQRFGAKGGRRWAVTASPEPDAKPLTEGAWEEVRLWIRERRDATEAADTAEVWADDAVD